MSLVLELVIGVEFCSVGIRRATIFCDETTIGMPMSEKFGTTGTDMGGSGSEIRGQEPPVLGFLRVLLCTHEQHVLEEMCEPCRPQGVTQLSR